MIRIYSNPRARHGSIMTIDIRVDPDHIIFTSAVSSSRSMVSMRTVCILGIAFDFVRFNQ